MKLPPYGKALRQMRDLGQHPNWVLVGYMDNWCRPEQFSYPVINIPKQDYEKGVYDFSILAGLAVYVSSDSFNEDVLFDLLIEVATHASLVRVFFPFQKSEHLADREFSDLLWCYRKPNSELGRFDWPRGWSDQLNFDYVRRRDALLAFLSGDTVIH